MPANVTPEYLEAKEKYRLANSPEEQMAALQEMLRTIPKHKGTEKMQADIKKRISQTKEEIQKSKSKGAQRQKPVYAIDRQGAGRVVLAGPPNAGKSALINALTNAETEVAQYPFTTGVPQPAMMPYENVQVQLIDLPPLHPDMSPPWLTGLLKSADSVLLVLDLGDDDLLSTADTALTMLQDKNVNLTPAFVEPIDDFGLIIPAGVKEKTATEKEREELNGDGDLFDESGNLQNQRPQSAFIVGNKNDTAGADFRLDLLLDMYDEFPVLTVSAREKQAIEPLKKLIWLSLGKIRVYSKPPRKEPHYDRPFVVEQGTTVIEFARVVHKDFAENFKFAKAWSDRTFDGQRVGQDFVLRDGDVIELHA